MGGIFAAKNELQHRLHEIGNVKSVAISKTPMGLPCIVVLVNQDTPKSQIEQIPQTVDDFEVRIQELHSIALH